MTPRVSILLSVRNEQDHLSAALASLFRQTLADWELIAVDDGSTDATPALLAAAAANDGRIRVLRRPAEGLVAALNAGLELCRAPLVARMDGDDICHPRRLEGQEAFLRANPEAVLVSCRVRHFPRPALQGGMLAYEAWHNGLLTEAEIRRDLFVESPFPHPSVMFRREAVLALGGYRDRGWPEDYDLWLRLARGPGRFASLPDVLLFWRDRPSRLTRTGRHYRLEAFRACKVHHLRQGFLAGAATVTLWGAGQEGKAWRRALKEVGIGVDRWIEVDPRKVGQIIHGAPVVHCNDLGPDGQPILVTIGARGARSEVREWALERGLREGTDFLCVT